MSDNKKPTDTNDKQITPLDQEYYDKAYFETGSKKIIDRVTGKEKKWGYHGTDWSGNYYIVHGLLETLNCEIGSIFDAGCGQGSFVDYAIRCGFVSKGCDFSKFAVDSAHHYSKGFVYQCDVTKGIPEESESYDVVFSSDMLEHLPKSKERFVMEEFYRITRKWIFLQFPVVSNVRDVFDIEIHGEDHPLYAHFMIAGHLNMQLRSWWDYLFKEIGFVIRDDLVMDDKGFRWHVPREVIANWNNIVILEKP